MGVFVVGALVVSLFYPIAARAADSSTTPKSDWNYKIGAGVHVGPNYEGSKHYGISPFPLVEVSWRDTVSLSSTEGLGVVLHPLSDEGFFVSGGVGYWSGRKEGADKDHDDALRGLGTLSGGAVGKLEAGYEFDAFSIGFGIARDIGNDRDGTTLTLNGGYKIYESRKLKLSGKVSATWADDEYMSNIFGITPVQAGNSLKRYAPFEAEAGLKDIKFGLTAGYSLTQSVSLFATANVAHLLGDAADSPLVEDQGSANQFGGSLGVVYRF